MELLFKLFTEIDNNHVSDCLFLDYSKAFNTVDHVILIEKLKFYGMNTRSVRWFTNYLNERNQRTVVDNVLSKKVKLECGVFQ